MGRLAMIGLAFPNAPSLGLEASSTAGMSSQAIRQEIDRLVVAADAIASIPGAGFLGLAHSQLRPAPANSVPLKIFLAPAEIPGLPTEITIGARNFQALVNTEITLPPQGGRTLVRTKEGCFSSGPVSVVTKRPDTIERLTTTTQDGEQITATEITGLPAIVMQHEDGHNHGRRAAAQAIGGVYNWVSRDQLTDYRTYTSEDYDKWPTRCSADQVKALFSEPSYAFFPTPELQEAFQLGWVLQHDRAVNG